MKIPFLLLFLALAAQAGPITFTYHGAYQPVDDGIFVNLENFWNSPHDRTVTIVASEPLSEFRAHFDNRPNDIGSGFKVFLDDELVLNTGSGALVDTMLTFCAVSPFTHIRIETNWMPGWLERGTITGFSGRQADPFPPPDVNTIHNPEPSTMLLLIPALLFCLWKARRRPFTTAGE